MAQGKREVSPALLKTSKTMRYKTQQHRERIQVGMIMGRLHKHVKGEIEMRSTQIRAAEILLRKAIPDLAMVDITSKGESITFNFSIGQQDGAQPGALEHKVAEASIIEVAPDGGKVPVNRDNE